MEEVALGFISVANEAMCRPIRALTQAKGYDIQHHTLASFGGAGGQHASAIARNLGIHSIFVHRFSGILSAYGMGLADIVHEKQEPCALTYEPHNFPALDARLQALRAEATLVLTRQGFSEAEVEVIPYLNLRYFGTDTAVMTLSDTIADYQAVFTQRYQREYGFTLDRPILVDDIRVRAIGKSRTRKPPTLRRRDPAEEIQSTTTPAYFQQGWQDTRVYQLSELLAGDEVQGPAMLIDRTSTLLVEPGCTASITSHGDVLIIVGTLDVPPVSTALDSIQLSIFSHRFMSIAEQMGRTLQRTSVSTNIKERLDYSCALFGPDGGLVANAPHLPVHLGAMQEAVRFQVRLLSDDWRDGDVVLSNHPQAGGSHLPDITVITPVFRDGKKVFFVASRGHHADIGGISAGSMPPFSKHLYEEGAAVVSFKLVKGGVFDEAGITSILQAPAALPLCSGTRNLSDNLSDLRAQVAANQRGIRLMGELIDQYGLDVVQAYMTHIRDNAETAVRDMLKELSRELGLKEVDTLHAEDWMDDGSRLCLALTIDRRDGSAVFDFAGTSAEVYGNINSPPAVTYSAIIYCLRCLVKRDIPLNQGCLNSITVRIPRSSFLNPSEKAAVVGGNVLTSQRVTDVVLRAFHACAASQGCMNNFTMGDHSFGYYETIAGGAGAGNGWEGQSGVHTHMTNVHPLTLTAPPSSALHSLHSLTRLLLLPLSSPRVQTRITDPEVMERRYPVLIEEFGLRPNSGGRGRWNGGHGVIRRIRFLRELSVGILSERRAFAPWGLDGGEDGQRGLNLIVRKDGSVVNLGGKNTYLAQRGDAIVIQSPGGGGYGRLLKEGEERKEEAGEEEEVVKVVEVTRTVTTTTVMTRVGGGSVAAYQAEQESA